MRSPYTRARAKRPRGPRARAECPLGLRRGFTLFELLVVLVLLALLAATTIRYYFSRAEVTLENAAILLARDLRAAQHRSIFLGEPSHFVFDGDGHGYLVTDEQGQLARNPETDQAFERHYTREGIFHGVEIVAVEAGGDRTLLIDSRGQPTEDLAVTLVYRGERRTVRYERSTGCIAIDGSTSGWADRDA